MSLIPSLRRLALPMLAIALALPPTTATAQELTWTASASYAFTGNEGNVYYGLLDHGLAKPGGRFTATFVTEISESGIDGSNVIQFGGPHTLQLAFHYDFTSTGGAGVYAVIGGTGRYADATGSGVTLVEDNGDGTGTVVFSGTLSK